MANYKFIFAIVALVCIQQGLSLKCHECNLSKECNDPYEESKAPIKECAEPVTESTTTEETSPKPPISRNNNLIKEGTTIEWQCARKTLTKPDGTDKQTERKCIKKDEPFCTGLPADKKLFECVICSDDECNGAGALMVSFFIVSAMLATLFVL